MKHILFLVSISLLLFSHCTKHKTEPYLEVCEGPVLQLDIEGHFVYKLEGDYKTPCFNPNNADEFIFQGITSDKIPCLFKYNMHIGEKTPVICSETILSHPKWSKKDWIIFTKIDNNVYKIKSNGDSLTQLTFEGNAFSPEWNKTGDKFIYADIGTFHGVSRICDEDGNSLSIHPLESVKFYCWQHDSLALGAFAEGQLQAINFYSYELAFVVEFEPDDFFIGAPQWVGENEFVWSTYEGIYKTNIDGWTIFDVHDWGIEKIVDACGFTRYYEPTYSDISDKLIFHKHEEKILGPQRVLLKHSLVMMNPDGTEMEEIIIPD